jgi:hypothetical protein
MLDTLSFLINRRRASRKGIGYIFCINSGRAGSKYLAALLGTASGVYSFHEPEPQMIGNYLRMVAEKGCEATFALRRIKSKAIVKIASRFPDRSVYAETSHMFIKTFYDVVLHDLENVVVIHLQRDLLQTLKSFVQLCYFSEKNTTWPDWMISPNARTASIKCIGTDRQLDYIDLSIAYLIDIEARAKSFQHRYPEIPFHTVDIKDLNDTKKIRKLFADLGLSFTRETEEVIGKKINQRANLKEKYVNPTDELNLEARIQDYLRKGQESGIHFPERILRYA